MYAGSGLASGSAAPGSGGSGARSRETSDEIQPIFEQIFPSEERIGQLYSYRRNLSSAILRTRWSIYEEEGINVSVGIRPDTADGIYSCVAANVIIANVTVSKIARIMVKTGENNYT